MRLVTWATAYQRSAGSLREELMKYGSFIYSASELVVCTVFWLEFDRLYRSNAAHISSRDHVTSLINSLYEAHDKCVIMTL